MSGIDWGLVALLLAVLVPSVVLHEVAHGVAANHFGDDTARRAGRLTLNPLRHIDPFGTLLLPALLALSGLGAFGFAKPVPVNVARLRDPRRHSLYVSLAGPATNIALVVAATLLLRGPFAGQFGRASSVSDLPVVIEAVFWFGMVNVLLAVFNLLPIPPLDGSAVVERVLPERWWPGWLRLRPYGLGIVLVLVLAVPNTLERIFEPALRLWAGSL